jgi:hypothetical protein
MKRDAVSVSDTMRFVAGVPRRTGADSSPPFRAGAVRRRQAGPSSAERDRAARGGLRQLSPRSPGPAPAAAAANEPADGVGARWDESSPAAAAASIAINVDAEKQRSAVLCELVRGFHAIEAASPSGGLATMVADFKRGFGAAARNAATEEREAVDSLSATVREKAQRLAAQNAELLHLRELAASADVAKARARAAEDDLALLELQTRERVSALELSEQRAEAEARELRETLRGFEARLAHQRRTHQVELLESTTSLRALCSVQEALLHAARSGLQAAGFSSQVFTLAGSGVDSGAAHHSSDPGLQADKEASIVQVVAEGGLSAEATQAAISRAINDAVEARLTAIGASHGQAGVTASVASHTTLARTHSSPTSVFASLFGVRSAPPAALAPAGDSEAAAAATSTVVSAAANVHPHVAHEDAAAAADARAFAEAEAKAAERERLHLQHEAGVLREKLLEAQAERDALHGTIAILRRSADRADAVEAELEVTRASLSEMKVQRDEAVRASGHEVASRAALNRMLVHSRALEAQL